MRRSSSEQITRRSAVESVSNLVCQSGFCSRMKEVRIRKGRGVSQVHSPSNQVSACEWRLVSRLLYLMRAVKSLSLVDSAITMILRTDKLDLYAESQESSCVLMASFPGLVFGTLEYRRCRYWRWIQRL